MVHIAGTRSEEIRQRIADDIVSGRLRPGQRLEELQLADQFKVSRTPVRDALRELSGTGLVEIRPNRGTWVAEIDAEQLEELFEAFAEIEALCARLCAVRLTVIERRRLELLHEESESYVTAGDHQGYGRLNEQIHDTIYQGGRNRALTEIVRGLRHRTAPFRLPQFYITNDRMKVSYAEHGALVEAIVREDAQAAYAAMYSHIANSSVNVIGILRESLRR